LLTAIGQSDSQIAHAEGVTFEGNRRFGAN
jgi:hypothetical protein